MGALPESSTLTLLSLREEKKFHIKLTVQSGDSLLLPNALDTPDISCLCFLAFLCGSERPVMDARPVPPLPSPPACLTSGQTLHSSSAGEDFPAPAGPAHLPRLGRESISLLGLLESLSLSWSGLSTADPLPPCRAWVVATVLFLHAYYHLSLSLHPARGSSG